MKSFKFLFTVLVAFFLLSFANGQTITKDVVFANWNFTLKPDVRAERFESFMVDEYIPAFEKSFTGVEIILVKGDRGVKKGAYCVLLVFKSLAVRNEWWPADGIMSDKAKEASAKMKAQDDRLNTMIAWESFTDWLVL
jgi:hypothetical protein